MKKKTLKLIGINKLTKITPMNGGTEIGPIVDPLCSYFAHSAVFIIPWSISNASVRLSFLLFQIRAHTYYDIKYSSNNVPLTEWNIRDLTKELSKRMLCKIKHSQVSREKLILSWWTIWKSFYLIWYKLIKKQTPSYIIVKLLVYYYHHHYISNIVPFDQAKMN